MISYRTVIFPEVKSGAQTVYPDDRKMFKHTRRDGAGNVIAKYKGALPLTAYVEPVKLRTNLTRREFIDRLTKGEYRTILNAVKTDDAVAKWWGILQIDVHVNLEASYMTTGMQAVVDSTTMLDARRDELLQGITE